MILYFTRNRNSGLSQQHFFVQQQNLGWKVFVKRSNVDTI